MSITEVAKLAGVSHATVSRVINHHSNVSSENVQRVQEAMRKLRYVPPAKRRGPTPKSSSGIRTGNIGMLFVSEAPTLAATPVLALVLHTVQEELASRGFNLMLGQVTARGGVPPMAASGQLDGLLMHGLPPSDDIRQQLIRYSACVWLLSQRREHGYWGDRVSPDNVKIGEMAARYLIDRGHQRIAMINCDPLHLGFLARQRGFESVAHAAGVPFVMVLDDNTRFDPNEHWSTSDPHFEALVDRLRQAEGRGPGPMPTGLFIPRDAITVRLYRALRSRGIKPGRDIEIISCDNIPALDGLDPRPATIDIRPDQLGRRAVEQLAWQISNRSAPMNVTSTVEPTLILGDERDAPRARTKPDPPRGALAAAST